MILIIVVCAGAAIAGSVVLFNKHKNEADQKRGISAADFSNRSNVDTLSPARLQKLVGRWIRPDGGYVIDISNVDTGGKLQAAYFNPRPINVSQAQVTQNDKETKIMIELRDVGYPLATYSLTYSAKQDVLVGHYFQPTAGQTFNVIFTRKQ